MHRGFHASTIALQQLRLLMSINNPDRAVLDV